MNLQEAKELIEISPFQYYVYALKRPNGNPFYIGKGSNGRIAIHEWEAYSCPQFTNPYKCNIIKKIKRNNKQIDYDVLLFTNNEHFAFYKEKELIKEYYQSLSNLTDGGEGISGCSLTFSKEHKAKLKLANTGKKHSDKAKQKMAKAKQNMSVETKRKMALSQIGNTNRKGTKTSEKGKKNMSLAHIGLPSNKLGYKASKETKRKLSISHLGNIPSEKTRQKMILAQKIRREREKQNENN